MKFIPVLLLFFFYSQNGFGQDYQKIHKDAIVVDSHNDFPSLMVSNGFDLGSNLKGRSYSDLDRFKEGGVDVQIFSIFCDDRYGKGTAYAYANREIDSLYSVAKRNPDRMSIVKNSKELNKAIKEHKLAAMMGMEGGHMMEDSLVYLERLYQRGIRYMTLTWNNSTSWASSARDESDPKSGLRHKGLNPFGIQVVKKMNDLGILVDLSHVGEQTFWDAIRTSTKPILVSHSGVHRICPVFRNLKDDQILAIGKNKGVIMVNFFSGFVDSSYFPKFNRFMNLHQKELDSLNKLKLPEYLTMDYFSKKYHEETESFRPPLSLLIDHIDYIIHLIGVDHVGLGSDFDGINSSPKGLDDVSDFPHITQALLQRGYSEKDIDKILGGNILRVFKANGI